LFLCWGCHFEIRQSTIEDQRYFEDGSSQRNNSDCLGAELTVDAHLGLGFIINQDTNVLHLQRRVNAPPLTKGCIVVHYANDGALRRFDEPSSSA
jgi:hypothetical protein